MSHLEQRLSTAHPFGSPTRCLEEGHCRWENFPDRKNRRLHRAIVEGRIDVEFYAEDANDQAATRSVYSHRERQQSLT